MVFWLRAVLMPFPTTSNWRVLLGCKDGHFFPAGETHSVQSNGQSCLQKCYLGSHWAEENLGSPSLRLESQSRQAALAEAVHVCCRDQRGPKLCTDSWTILRSKGPVESTSWADLKTAWTWNVLLYPNTDPLAEYGSFIGSKYFSTITI